jgi:transcriptional regulator with XRE-family HTH domain
VFEVTAGDSLGPLIAARRRELGRSQERLAEQLCTISGRMTVTKNEVSRYEREERIPSADSLRHLALALAMPLATLERAAARSRAQRRKGRPPLTAVTVDDNGLFGEEVETERRQMMRSLAAASLVVAGWPVGARSGVDLPRRITMDHVAELRDATGLYRGWVSRHGGGGVRQHVATLLERASMMHSSASEEAIRRELLDCIADLAGLAAYISRDLEAHSDAREMYQLALQAARAAGDRHLGGHLIVRMAGYNIELRQPDDTLVLLDKAQHAAKSVLTPGERANQLCIKAWAHAQRGEVEAVRRAVGQAEEEFARGKGGISQDYGRQHVTEAELYSLTGAGYAELAKSRASYADPAIYRLRRAISLRGQSNARNRTLDMVSLAEVLAVAGDVGESKKMTKQATDHVDQLSSNRLVRRLGELRQRLPEAA